MPIPEPLTRRMPITHKEIEKYGYTDGCPGCDAKKRGEVARRGHSEKCRRRIEGKMKEDEEGRRKMEKTEERITHRMARDLEKADKKRKAEEEKKDPKEAEAEDMEEDRAKKRKQEETDHRTAASSGCQATVDVDSGIAPGGVAVDKRGDGDDEAMDQGVRRGKQKKKSTETKTLAWISMLSRRRSRTKIRKK